MKDERLLWPLLHFVGGEVPVPAPQAARSRANRAQLAAVTESRDLRELVDDRVREQRRRQGDSLRLLVQAP